MVVGLTGNPNTGKSTLFNALTGLRQHTGNWPGKTVSLAWGYVVNRGKAVVLVDLPGIYSLRASSAEEEIARDFLCFSRPDATVVVVDACSLERGLSLALQVIEMTPKVVVCVNLIDEARRRRIDVDVEALSGELGVPAVATAARYGEGLVRLMDTVAEVAMGVRCPDPVLVTYDQDIEQAISRMLPGLAQTLRGGFNPRWVALRLLAGDWAICDRVLARSGGEPAAGAVGEAVSWQ